MYSGVLFEGYTALQLALESKQYHVARFLLEYTSDEEFEEHDLDMECEEKYTKEDPDATWQESLGIRGEEDQGEDGRTLVQGTQLDPQDLPRPHRPMVLREALDVKRGKHSGGAPHRVGPGRPARLLEGVWYVSMLGFEEVPASQQHTAPARPYHHTTIPPRNKKGSALSETASSSKSSPPQQRGCSPRGASSSCADPLLL